LSEFAASIECSEAISVSPSAGALRPLIPRPGALPLDPAGGSAPRLPLYARALRARHGPPLPNPKHATVFNSTLAVRECDGD